VDWISEVVVDMASSRSVLLLFRLIVIVIIPLFYRVSRPAMKVSRNKLYCASKRDTFVAQYNFNAYPPILVIFGRYISE